MKQVKLNHPGMPLQRIWVRPSFLRRLGIRKSRYATIGELAGSHWA